MDLTVRIGHADIVHINQRNRADARTPAPLPPRPTPLILRRRYAPQQTTSALFTVQTRGAINVGAEGITYHH